MVSEFLSGRKIAVASIADKGGGVIPFMLLDNVLSAAVSNLALGQ